MRKFVLATILAMVVFGMVACLPSGNKNVQGSVRVAAFYPWFGGPGGMGWNQQGLDPFTHYHPSLGYYVSADPAVIKNQINAMQYGRIQGAFASWWGQGSYTDNNIPALLSAANGTGFKWTLYYEPEGQGNPSSAQINSDLSYILSKYAGNPNWLYRNQKPVLFVYADPTDGCSMLSRWAGASNTSKFYIVQKVFPGYLQCANQPDSWHQYGPDTREDHQKGFSFSISPGFWKANEATPRLPRDIGAFQTAVKDMVAANEPWQVVNTFNEWGEGSAVESATEWASSSGYGQYLDALHDDGTTTTTTTTNPTTTTTVPVTTTTTVPVTTTTTTSPPPSGICNNGSSAPAKYDSVVVFSFENRTWSDVGGTNFGGVPYFNSLFKQGCTTFANYTEPDTTQNSATQYVSTAQGNENNTVRNDCSPSSSCESLADNIFRQVRNAGLAVHNYVEGATTGCSASGNAWKHIPDGYFFGGNDHSFCSAEVRPFSEFNPSSPPVGFSFITPTLCNDGHDCSNSTVSSWAQTHVGAVLNSSAYKAGKVLVQIWYDEDHPVPNMFIAPTAKAGTISTAINYASSLRLWEEALGLPVNLGNAPGATDIRPFANI